MPYLFPRSKELQSVGRVSGRWRGCITTTCCRRAYESYLPASCRCTWAHFLALAGKLPDVIPSLNLKHRNPVQSLSRYSVLPNIPSDSCTAHPRDAWWPGLCDPPYDEHALFRRHAVGGPFKIPSKIRGRYSTCADRTKVHDLILVTPQREFDRRAACQGKGNGQREREKGKGKRENSVETGQPPRKVAREMTRNRPLIVRSCPPASLGMPGADALACSSLLV